MTAWQNFMLQFVFFWTFGKFLASVFGLIAALI